MSRLTALYLHLYQYLDQYDLDHPIYFSKESPIASLKKYIFLEGYFLNYRIHNPDVINKIKKFFEKFKINEELKNLKYISIHLRELHGNDPSKIGQKVDNLNINYYSQALNKIKSDPTTAELKNAVVFCDTDCIFVVHMYVHVNENISVCTYVRMYVYACT